MTTLLGFIIVIALTAVGFILSGYNPLGIFHISEILPIGGLMIGCMIIMSPKEILFAVFKGVKQVPKGIPYRRSDYEELLLCLNELFVLGRRNGMIALEQHVTEPETSTILLKYPRIAANTQAVDFLCDSLKPLVDGRLKPDQLEPLLEKSLAAIDDHLHKPVTVLNKVSDSMPAFGILAAVMGIIITMTKIGQDTRVIGLGVASALCGTFYGVFLSYAVLSPVAMSLDFINQAHVGYFNCIKEAVISFASGNPPAVATEVARRSIDEKMRPSSRDLENLLQGAA